MSLSPSRRRPEHGEFAPANTIASTAAPLFPLRESSGNINAAATAGATGRMPEKVQQGQQLPQQRPPQQPQQRQQQNRITSNDLSTFFPSAPQASGFSGVPNSRATNLHGGTGAAFNNVMADYESMKTHAGFRLPQTTANTNGIFRPTNPSAPTTQAAPRPVFSSKPAGFTPANAPMLSYPKSQPTPIHNFIDLTREDKGARDEDDGFDPAKALSGGKFGDYDPTNFMDSAQANENIQKLLEGAFEEDDEDKPKSRLRRRKQARVDENSAADRLAAKLAEVNVSKDEPSKKEEHDAKAEDDEEDDGSVDGLKVKLLPHQIDGVAWMLDKEIGERKRNGVLPKGGILADDMGLGKTIQAISLILSNPRPTDKWIDENPKKKIPKTVGKGTLVVAPLALIKQWEAEIKEKVTKEHKLKVLVHHGQSRTKHFEDLKKYDIVITTYQTLTSEHDGTSPDDNGIKVGCFGVQWYRVILDEAHSIKNRNAKMTKAAYELSSVYRWCLTGTPMQNNLDELQSLIRFLRIKPYMDMRVWKEQISMPMKNGRGGLAMKRLQYFLKACMKRRTKDVLKQSGALKFGKAGADEDADDDKREGFKIVERVVETVETDFSERERALYDRLAARTERNLDAMMGEKKDYIGALVLLLRLRQLCNHPNLIKGNLAKEENMTAPSGAASGTSRPAKDDVNDMADLFTNLTVETRKCDVCQVALSQKEAAAGNIRCSECDADLAEHDQSSVISRADGKSRKKHSKSHNQREKSKQKASAKTARQRKIIDSDDEEDEGEWLVPASQQSVPDLGKAGGQADEDAEGGGEWLRSDDEDEKSEDGQDEGEDSFVSVDTDPHTEAESSSEAEDYIPPVELAAAARGVTSTKITRLLAILEAEASRKTIVFSEFTSMLDLIEPHLRGAGIAFARYDGKMAPADREASLAALRNDARTRVLLCSLRCGALGLNLTAASRVVLLEPFWNPFVEEQAIDRVHRLNQTQDVRVYRLTVRGTVEERILALQQRKRELARMAIEGGAASGAKGKMNLSLQDIMALFRRDAVDAGDAAGGAGGGVGAQSVRVLPPSGGVTTIGSSADAGKRRAVSGGAGAKPSPFDPAYGRRW